MVQVLGLLLIAVWLWTSYIIMLCLWLLKGEITYLWGLEGSWSKAKEELLIELSLNFIKLLLREKGSGPWVDPVTSTPLFQGRSGQSCTQRRSVFWLNGFWDIICINDSPGTFGSHHDLLPRYSLELQNLLRTIISRGGWKGSTLCIP